MKSLKKLIALLLAMIVAASTVSVFAEDETQTDDTADTAVISENTEETAEEASDEASPEETADGEEAADEEAAEDEVSENLGIVEIESVNLGDVLSSEEGWVASGNNEITIENNKLVNNNESTAYFAYERDNFADKLIQYKQTFNFNNSWGGFVLNSTDYKSAIWSGGRGYLVVIKENQIELQRWGANGQQYLAVLENTFIKNNTPANISAGAVNVDGGVNIFMFVDGKCVLNCFDNSDYALTEGTYFTLYETAGSAVEAYDGGDIAPVPVALTATGKANAGEEYSISHLIAAFTEEWDESYTYEWFYAAEKETKLDEYSLSKEQIETKLVGDGLTHVVAAEELGGYYTVKAKNSNDELVLVSSPIIINNFDYVVNSSIVLHIDCEYAYVNGVKSQIDPDDFNVAPAIVDSRTLVPVRFIAESLGADVEWDDATRKITITLDGKQIVMTLDKKEYTVDGEAFELDVPAGVIYDRTMVPVRVVSEAFGKDVFWDGENELIVISDGELGLDEEKDAATLAYVLEQIIKRM